jgi:DedD protein
VGRYDTELDLPEADASEHDPEISLGTGTIVGIFFALALSWAVVFGLGYTMGRKSVQDSPMAAASSPGNFTGLKPAAGSTTGQPVALVPAEKQVVVQSEASAPAIQPSAVVVPTKSAVTPADAAIVGDPLPGQAAVKPVAAVNLPPSPASAPGGLFVVQVAAVSTQDLADMLLSSLRRRGYAVSARSEPQDKLLHIQIGPFVTRKDAEIMRDRVTKDGFNAIVK